MKKNKYKVVILAAGEGKRLRPLTLDRPKCLVEIDGLSLLDRQLATLKHPKIKEIIIIGGYKIGLLKGKADKILENPRYHETNMVWTLFCAEDELNENLIISYGDIVYSKKVLEDLINSNSDVSVIIDKDWESYWSIRNEDPLSDAETLKLRKDGTIFEIGQKPKSIKEIEGQYIGLTKFSQKGIKRIRKIFNEARVKGNILGKPLEQAYMTDLIQLAIESGLRVSSVPIKGEWIEIDKIEDIKSSLISGRLKNI